MSLSSDFGTTSSASLDFSLYWHGERIADFKLGDKKEWAPIDPVFNSLFVMDEEEKLPMFLDNLRPEGWLKKQLAFDEKKTPEEIQKEYLRDGKRFLSNIMIHPKGCTPKEGMKLQDEHVASLSDFTDEKGIFIGTYKTPRGLKDDPAFEQTAIKYWGNRYMPRFSGAELKFPVSLDTSGDVTLAVNAPFTAIAKYPGKYGFEALGVNEFLGMKMAQAAGLKTPAYALVDQGNDLPPVYLIERYDISHKGADNAPWQITQDFCTLTKTPSFEKFWSSIEKVGKCIKEISKTSKNNHTQENLEQLFKRAVFGWFMGDSDLHLKNMSMLYSYDPKTKELTDITFAPCYDPTTDLFQQKEGAAAVLPIDGRKNHFKMSNFVALAKNLGIFKDTAGAFDKEQAIQAVQSIAEAAAKTAIDFTKDLPHFVKEKPWSFDIKVQTSIVVDRARNMGVLGLDWDSEPVWKELHIKGPARRQEAHKASLSVADGGGARRRHTRGCDIAK